MDFFRKFFPASKKNITSDTTDGICITKDTSLDIRKVPQEENNNPNIFDTILTLNNTEKTTKDGSFEEVIGISDNSNKSLHSVDLPSSEISLNDINTDQKLPGIKQTNDITPKIITFNEVIEKNNDERPINADTNVLEPFIVTDGLVCNKEPTVFNEIEPNTTNDTGTLNIGDETSQTLKEFDEVLNTYERSDNFRTEFINLDDFYEIFNTLDNVKNYTSVIDPFDSKNKNGDNTEKIDDVIYTELKVASKIIEDIDVISINSSVKDSESQTQDVKETIYINSDTNENDSQSSECDGYNSSDFEFISEAEANLDGLIINFKGVNKKSSQNISEFDNFEQRNDEGFNTDDVFDPCEGPSRQNGGRNQFEDRSYRDNHQIPLGDDYLALFEGIYNPVLPMSEIFFLENKSVRTSAMNIQYDGIGFVKQLAMRRHQPDSSEDEFADEAKECAKQILNTYPRENRKRRRRH